MQATPRALFPDGAGRVNTRSLFGVYLSEAVLGQSEPATESRPEISDATADDAVMAAEWPDTSPLVRAAQQGDRGAFWQLYRIYAPMVHGIFLSRVASADVDDLVHDVFLRALPRLHTLRDPSRFGGWLAQIARNSAIDHFRRSRHTPEPADVSEVAAEEPREPGLDPAVVLDAVRSLPPAYRETLMLRLVEGMTGPEIAARCGLSHGSVRVNLHRGMQFLREKLGSAP